MKKSRKLMLHCNLSSEAVACLLYIHELDSEYTARIYLKMEVEAETVWELKEAGAIELYHHHGFRGVCRQSDARLSTYGLQLADAIAADGH